MKPIIRYSDLKAIPKIGERATLYVPHDPNWVGRGGAWYVTSPVVLVFEGPIIETVNSVYKPFESFEPLSHINVRGKDHEFTI